MSIPSIGALSGINPAAALTDGLDLQAATAASNAPSASNFQATLGGVVDDLRSLQSTSNELAIKAVSGDLADIHDATIASTRAQVTLELVAAVRNKGVDAFNEIMRMQA
ncbi:flagellar hook-basal body complex protein FliE [Salinibacterium hongtaonis]|uniref:Flagellar hook-basal body complex protein FliE n=1 Tax=Homoserinimonas hongtaonis TaxID=2079791 RepID=A0A2U1T1R8_9MICO|nr:flagellar hook-basal body complex protein FliE [Salinibacterium hongtaonis]AWB90391.1 flagellar hook-basal body complex protein FliE [Salinibacterium hongtaonis]PWB97831.1 flagellar hook-basal body complex protein FliE [Salinibacterium hongtaonis]